MKNNDGIFVIFGITGDLATRKLLPALYQLADRGQLPEHFKILGTTRRNTQIDDIIFSIEESLKSEGSEPNQKTIDHLRTVISLVNMNISVQDDYSILKQALEQNAQSLNVPVNRLYYLAVPPQMVSVIVDNLKAHDLNISNDPTTETRLLVEKPFGHDTASALNLIKQMDKVFNEEYIYRVDHYLAKNTVQNILDFKAKNPNFPARWDNNNVKHITITASERIGIEGRVNFYENTGALRDLIQNHLLQLLALITMEHPDDSTSLELHKNKLELLDSIPQIKSEDVEAYTARGQYEGYQEEVGNPNSTTETYAAIKLYAQNERWDGIPMILRAGKAMSKKVTEISIAFKDSTLVIRIQPNEGILLVPVGPEPKIDVIQDGGKHIHSYERVLADAIRGDQALFTTDKEVLSSWRIIEEVLKAWSGSKENLQTYSRGSDGPESAKKLI